MQRTILAVIAVVAIGAAAVRGQDKAEVTKTPPVAMPRPGPEVEKLGYFVGAWTSAGKIKPGPTGEGGATTGRDSCGWMPGKFFVGCMIMSDGPMGRIQTEGIMGWDADKKLYSWTSFDSKGRNETSTGKFEDGTWTWSGQTKMGDKLVKTRYVISDTTPEGYAFRWETSPDGKAWDRMMEGKVTKMAGRPTPARATTPVPTLVPTPTPEGDEK
jgi:hypothetical protein